MSFTRAERKIQLQLYKKRMNRLKERLSRLLTSIASGSTMDLNYFIRGGLWLTGAHIILSMSSFLLVIVFANLLPKETFGNYRYVLSVTSILAMASLPGMNTAITQAIAQGQAASVHPALRAKIRWGLLGGLASLLFASYYYFNEDRTLAMAFSIAALFLPITHAFELYASILHGKKKFDVSAKYSAVCHTVSTLFLVTTVVLSNNLAMILLSYFVPWTVLRLIFFNLTINRSLTDKTFDSRTLSYGKHLTLMTVITTAATYLDRVLIFHYLGTVQVAIYSVAIAFPEQIKAILKIVGTLVLPKFSQRKKEEVKKSVRIHSWKLGFAILMAIFLYLVGAPYIFHLFFPNYTDSVFYSQLFALSLITGVAILPNAALQSQKAQKELYLCNTLTSLLQIALLFGFTRTFGLTGVIAARVIGRFVNMFYMFVLVRKM